MSKRRNDKWIPNDPVRLNRLAAQKEMRKRSKRYAKEQQEASILADEMARRLRDGDGLCLGNLLWLDSEAIGNEVGRSTLEARFTMRAVGQAQAIEEVVRKVKEAKVEFDVYLVPRIDFDPRYYVVSIDGKPVTFRDAFTSLVSAGVIQPTGQLFSPDPGPAKYPDDPSLKKRPMQVEEEAK